MSAYQQLALVQEQLGKKEPARASWTKVRDLAAGKPDQAKLGAEATQALDRLKP